MACILGISAYYHDAAAALVVDGRLVTAAQEERFSRVKHDAAFPRAAIDACLDYAGIDLAEVAGVCYYEKPLRKFERLLDTYLTFAPRGFASFRRAMPKWLMKNVNLRRELRRELGPTFDGELLFATHHESHAASAFFPSPFEEAAILTMDGVGEWATGSFGAGRGNRIEVQREMRFPHSLGLLYSAFTYFCGFKVNDGEYKLMGLAPYGKPRYADRIRRQLVNIHPDGSFFMDMRYFDYCTGVRMTSQRFAELFDGPPRRPQDPLTEREMDLAASVQAVAEEIIIKCARHVRQETGLDRLCLAGGVALNCVANGKLLAAEIFRDIWVQPAAGDAGGALGAALLAAYHHVGEHRVVCAADSQQGSLLGPELNEDHVRDFLDERHIDSDFFSGEQSLYARVARLLADGQVVGWVQGRMEFGPRALGGRSILADARVAGMQSRINKLVKKRESFRPFAPIVLAERATDYFNVPPGFSSPYMLFTVPVLPERRVVDPHEAEVTGVARLGLIRSEIPAVTHVDYSARIQTVDRDRNERLYGLLGAFMELTGCPILLNTSFNLKDEPIVCNFREAWNCFLATGLDCLVVGRFVIERSRLAPGVCQPIPEPASVKSMPR